MPYLVQCKSCSASAQIDIAADPDSAVNCDCCPEDHHHGQAADATGTPCRPVTITALGGSAAMTATAGG